MRPQKNPKKPKKGKTEGNEYDVSYVIVCKRSHTSTKLDVREYLNQPFVT